MLCTLLLRVSRVSICDGLPCRRNSCLLVQSFWGLCVFEHTCLSEQSVFSLPSLYSLWLVLFPVVHKQMKTLSGWVEPFCHGLSNFAHPQGSYSCDHVLNETLFTYLVHHYPPQSPIIYSFSASARSINTWLFTHIYVFKCIKIKCIYSYLSNTTLFSSFSKSMFGWFGL